jgi:hypothetical protein
LATISTEIVAIFFNPKYLGAFPIPIDINQPNLRKFKADFGNFKFTCSIEHTAFYMFDKFAKDLARQYAKKLFGRLGDVASLREGRHGLPPHRYWNYEGYICQFDKFGCAFA